MPPAVTIDPVETPVESAVPVMLWLVRLMLDMVVVPRKFDDPTTVSPPPMYTLLDVAMPPVVIIDPVETLVESAVTFEVS
jgi:hypothetical protein